MQVLSQLITTNSSKRKIALSLFFEEVYESSLEKRWSQRALHAGRDAARKAACNAECNAECIAMQVASLPCSGGAEHNDELGLISGNRRLSADAE